MKISSIILASIIFILELVFAFLEKETLRKIIKPFCMLSLTYVLISFGLTNPFLYITIGLGFLGDICLIFKKTNQIMFTLGIIFFFIGHLFYSYLFISLLSYKVELWELISLGVFGLLTPILSYKMLHPLVKEYTIPGTYYFYILLMDLLFATFLMVDQTNINTILIFIGVIIFIISDSILSFTTFILDIKRRDFYIMLTYLIAQSLIAINLVMLL